ncbi:MAG TPA: hypothetical protein VMQ83_10415 [Gammaproteobacteria bacterium]|nr:hypothetical protein [Gammaproteobacteria bacterium]
MQPSILTNAIRWSWTSLFVALFTVASLAQDQPGKQPSLGSHVPAPDQVDQIFVETERAQPAEHDAAPRSLGPFDADWYGAISRDGRYLTYVQWETGDLALRNLETGEIRNLTKKTGAWLHSNAFAIFSVISPR